MTTMISDLPRDLIEEIISWLPLKSMKAVRLTCKSWNNLSKSESFTKMHIGKIKTPTRQGEIMMIVTMPQKNYLMSGVVDVDPCIEHKATLSFPYNQESISRILHYEGLILCILKDLTRIVVWNPYWGQTRSIKLRYSHSPEGYDRFRYGLGYEEKESCRSVKFLRFIDYFTNTPEKQFFWYEIYDFDSGLWTTLDVTPHWGIFCHFPSVSLKGNCYWPCVKERSSAGPKDYIICFDFTRERFGPLLPLPSCRRDRKYLFVTLSCVKEEKIAALFQHHDDSYKDDLEIWITTKIEAEMVSWSKFLRMDTRPNISIRYQFSFFIDEEKNVFMGFGTHYDPLPVINIIGEAGYLTRWDLDVPADQNRWPHVCSYVPSSVQIKKLARGKRIEQSSLEKRRFDQNMLRLGVIEKLIKKQHWWEK